MESEVTTAEVLGITTEKEATRKREKKNQYRKQSLDVKEVEVINQHLLKNKENSLGKDDIPITAENITLGVA